MKNDLSKFSMGAVRDVLEIHEAKEILSRHDISHKGFKNERGLIGHSQRLVLHYADFLIIHMSLLHTVNKKIGAHCVKLTPDRYMQQMLQRILIHGIRLILKISE